jgi:hypothetical protein
MPDRHYSDEEVRRILALAAEAETAAAAEQDRPWTLADVERIGVEAGIAPHAISAAAVALEQQVAVPEHARLFGLPVAVSRAVPLSRHLSDEDWDRLVGQLRETFAARGMTRVNGARREWRVGNLRVTHEPAGSGALLQLRTRKGDARAFLHMGVMFVAAAAALAVMVGTRSHDPRRLTVAWLAGLAGVLMLLTGVLRLPAWARRRARQFEALAAYARQITAS